MNLNYLRHAKCSESTGKSLVAKKKNSQNAKCLSKYRQFVSMPLCTLMEKSDQMKESSNYQSLNQSISTELSLI